jgi:hypothetical protein
MATRTFTNGGVNNLWTTAGNWDTPEGRWTATSESFKVRGEFD